MGQSMKQLYKAVKFDIRKGIVQKFYLYIVVILLFSICCADFYMKLKARNAMPVSPSFLDTIIYVFRGGKEYVPGEDKMFQIPLNYLMITVFIGYLIGHYPVNELKENGKTYMMHFGNRYTWWRAKSIWNIFSIILFCAIGLLVITIFTAVGGDFNTRISNQMLQLLEFPILHSSPWIIIISSIGLNIMTLIAISQFQITLELIISPVLSYMVVITIWVISAYYYNTWLPGNFLMLYRTYVCRVNGVAFWQTVGICIVIWITSFIVGRVYIERKDIF